jgi:hypothetical protein
MLGVSGRGPEVHGVWGCGPQKKWQYGLPNKSVFLCRLSPLQIAFHPSAQQGGEGPPR